MQPISAGHAVGDRPLLCSPLSHLQTDVSTTRITRTQKLTLSESFSQLRWLPRSHCIKAFVISDLRTKTAPGTGSFLGSSPPPVGISEQAEPCAELNNGSRARALRPDEDGQAGRSQEGIPLWEGNRALPSALQHGWRQGPRSQWTSAKFSVS